MGLQAPQRARAQRTERTVEQTQPRTGQSNGRPESSRACTRYTWPSSALGAFQGAADPHAHAATTKMPLTRRHSQDKSGKDTSLTSQRRWCAGSAPPLTSMAASRSATGKPMHGAPSPLATLRAASPPPVSVVHPPASFSRPLHSAHPSVRLVHQIAEKGGLACTDTQLYHMQQSIYLATGTFTTKSPGASLMGKGQPWLGLNDAGKLCP